MRELFLDPRKNIARSPHAIMLLSATRDAYASHAEQVSSSTSGKLSAAVEATTRPPDVATVRTTIPADVTGWR